ncbi:MAG: hypothetical protein K2G93_02395 [Rikenella sp.]|nr:hypothetical protein [Rikenella sp.]
MKSVIVFFIVALIMPLTGRAQNYYSDGSVIKQGSETVFNCSISKYSISLVNPREYPRSSTPQENNVVGIKDRSVFKQALEEVFTPTELETYKDMILTFGIVHDASARPVDVWFSFDKEIGKTIPPSKFVELRERLLQLVEFATTFRLTPGKYYSWSENIIAPLWYYRDPQYYLPKSRSRKTNQ